MDNAGFTLPPKTAPPPSLAPPFLTPPFMAQTAEETGLLGERIGRNLKAGAVVALSGVLGAGKTCFAQGIARALTVREPVTSPTYTIVNEYEGAAGGVPLPFYHIDAYRLSGPDDFTALGGEEYLYGSGICVIEWPERLAPLLPETTLNIQITLENNGARLITII